MNGIKSNKELKTGQVIMVNFGENIRPVECAFLEPISGGYSKCLVKDIDPDRVVERRLNNGWSKHLIKNHARGAEYIVNVKQIEVDDE